MRKASVITGKAGDSSRPSSTDFTRRRFLFALGATSAGAAAPAVATASQAVDTPAGGDKSLGYRETDHVRDYYDSARF